MDESELIESLTFKNLELEDLLQGEREKNDVLQQQIINLELNFDEKLKLLTETFELEKSKLENLKIQQPEELPCSSNKCEPNMNMQLKSFKSSPLCHIQQREIARLCNFVKELLSLVEIDLQQTCIQSILALENKLANGELVNIEDMLDFIARVENDSNECFRSCCLVLLKKFFYSSPNLKMYLQHSNENYKCLHEELVLIKDELDLVKLDEKYKNLAKKTSNSFKVSTSCTVKEFDSLKKMINNKQLEKFNEFQVKVQDCEYKNSILQTKLSKVTEILQKSEKERVFDKLKTTLLKHSPQRNQPDDFETNTSLAQFSDNCERLRTEYQKSVNLFVRSRTFHKDSCGILPLSTSLKEKYAQFNQLAGEAIRILR